MTYVSNMAWRIGETINIYDQLDWCLEHGLRAVSFHAHAGYPGEWEGAPLLDMDGCALEKLKRSLRRFDGIEVHMPFQAILDPLGEGCVEEIARIAEKAEYVGADIATIHSRQVPPTHPAYDTWRRQIERLSGMSRGRIKMCLELTAGFEVLDTVDAPNVGFTLDIGHMVQPMDLWSDRNMTVPLSRYASWDALITSIAPRLWHSHLHDYNGEIDHIPLGHGKIDYKAVFDAYRKIGYAGMYCLELNPNRMVPEDIVRSADIIRAATGAL